jgi:hypothetical protein
MLRLDTGRLDFDVLGPYNETRWFNKGGGIFNRACKGRLHKHVRTEYKKWLDRYQT